MVDLLPMSSYLAGSKTLPLAHPTLEPDGINFTTLEVTVVEQKSFFQQNMILSRRVALLALNGDSQKAMSGRTLTFC